MYNPVSPVRAIAGTSKNWSATIGFFNGYKYDWAIDWVLI